jgi:hypothetical protein
VGGNTAGTQLPSSTSVAVSAGGSATLISEPLHSSLLHRDAHKQFSLIGIHKPIAVMMFLIDSLVIPYDFFMNSPRYSIKS